MCLLVWVYSSPDSGPIIVALVLPRLTKQLLLLQVLYNYGKYIPAFMN